jgi:hypothetical protein
VGLRRREEGKIVNSSIFCDITPRSALKVSRSFGATCRLHLQFRRISQARNKYEAGGKQSWRHPLRIFFLEHTHRTKGGIPVLSQSFPGGTEENSENRPLGYPASRPRFLTGNSRLRNSNGTDSTRTYDICI